MAPTSYHRLQLMAILDEITSPPPPKRKAKAKRKRVDDDDDYSDGELYLRYIVPHLILTFYRI